MDDDMIPEGSADDDTNSPQEYNAASPTEGDHSVEDDMSSQSNDTQGEDMNSDVEVDVWHSSSSKSDLELAYVIMTCILRILQYFQVFKLITIMIVLLVTCVSNWY